MPMQVAFMRLMVVLFTFCLWPPLGVATAVGFFWHAYRGKERDSTTHGSARLATWRDAMQAGLLDKKGLILGRAELLTTGAKAKQFIRLERFTHLATFAATGRGKGTGVLIPNLLTYPGNVVVTDKGGECFRSTSTYRGRTFRQPQYRLDPYHTCGHGGDAYNPLDGIDDQSLSFLDECRALAKLLVFREGTEPEPFWNDASELVVTAFVAFICACCTRKEDRNLISVHRLLASPQSYAAAVKAMQEVTTHHGVIAELGRKLTWFIEKELASILSNTNRHLGFLLSPPVAASVCRSSFDPAELRTARGASIFLCLPADSKIDVAAPMTRVWVGSLLHATAKALPSEEHKVLFLLDEIASLGRIDALEQAVCLLRGVGVRLWFFFQSLNQVRECYGEAADTILENIDTQQYFGINAFETADAISKRIGEQTIHDFSRAESDSTSVSMGEPFSQRQPGTWTVGTTLTRNQIARRVMFPDEVMRMPDDPAVALLFHRNLPVLPVVLPKHYCDPEFAHCLPDAPRSSRVPSIGWVWPAIAWLNPVKDSAQLKQAALVVVSIITLAIGSNPDARRRFANEGLGALFPQNRGIDASRPRAEPGQKAHAPETQVEPADERPRPGFVRIPKPEPVEPPANPKPQPPPARKPVQAARKVSPSTPQTASNGVQSTPPCSDPRCPHTGQSGPHFCFDSRWCPNVTTCPHLRTANRR